MIYNPYFEHAAGLQYTSRRVEDSGEIVRKCSISVPPAMPAAISFHVDYQSGVSLWRCSTSTGWIGSRWNFRAMRSRSRSSRISCD
jgi:hypothetical protein